MKTYKKLLGFTLFIFSITANSAELSGVQVERLEAYAGGNGRVAFYIDKALINPAGCSSPSKYLVDNDDIEGSKNILSLLLTAKAVDKPISIQVSDTMCLFRYPVVTRVAIQ